VPTQLNRREFYRYLGDMPGRFRSLRDPVWLPCLIVDISGSGARIASPQAISNTSVLQLEMTISGRIYIQDSVAVWAESSEDGLWHKYGLTWIGLTDADRDDLIRSLVIHQRINRPRRLE
jgi:hypothetical protein